MKSRIKGIGLDNPEKLYGFVEQHLAPKEYEKKEFGEVLTPLWLVEEMLNKVPKKIWSDPESKILDPAAGIGNFPIIAYKKLMTGLKDVIVDEGERKKHVLENMLYMVELNPVNSAIMRRIMDSGKKYDLNIVTGDFFDEKLQVKSKKIDLSKIEYTLIMGNPPYNASQNADGKRGGGNSLWPLFVKHSFPKIKKGGFLSFVHPPGWRKPESEQSKNRGLFEMMAHNSTPLYIEIHSSADGMKTFRCGTRYDWYVIKKKANSIGHKTTVKDINGQRHKLSLSEYLWLSNSDYSILLKIICWKPKFDDSRVIYSRNAYGTDSKINNIKSVKNKNYKYILIHSTIKNGVICMYSSENDRGHFGVSKVIFGESGINTPVLDVDGEYGMTQHAMAIPIKNRKDGIRLIKYLTSGEFKNMLKSCMWGNFGIDWRLFAYFRDGFWRDHEPVTRYVDKPVSCIEKKSRKK